MRITDTCPCGAAFSIDYPKSRNLSSATHHVTWLGFHTDCRERGPIPPQLEPSDHPGDAGQLDTMVERAHPDDVASRAELDSRNIGFRHQEST